MSRSRSDEDYAFGLYPDGSGVLRNKLGLRDAKALEEAEYRITAKQTRNAPAFPPTQAGYRALHRHLFGQVFEWAGEYRTVDFSKGGSRFATARFLDATMHTIFADLAQQDFLRNQTGERFADGAAHHISELNVAHPWREGNGRAMRLHLQQLAEQAGHSLDPLRLPKQEWNAASIRGFEGDERPLANLIAGALRPASLMAPDAAAAELRDAAGPARLAIQEATRTMRDRLGTTRGASEIIGDYRDELAGLADVTAAADRLAALGPASGLLQVHAPLSATPRDRAHAILAAAERLPSSLVSPQADPVPAAPGLPPPQRLDVLAAYMARRDADASQSTSAARSQPAPAPARDAAAPPRPTRRPRDPEPGF